MCRHKVETLTEGIKCTINPGSGDLPVGQLDAQKRLPNGKGMPSFASSAFGDYSEHRDLHTLLTSNIPWLTREAAKVYVMTNVKPDESPVSE